MTGLSPSVVAKDHKLEGAADSSTEALAQLRWHWTMDEDNAARVNFTDYAEAIGRSRSIVGRYAKGWLLYERRMAAQPAGAAFTIHDAIRLASQSEEQQQFSEAIAEGAQVPIARVARGDGKRETRDIIAQAKDRAARRGTDQFDEARDIAASQRQTRETNARHRKEKQARHTLRYVQIEGDLANAQRRLTKALKAAEGVNFDEEELELIRDSIAKVQAVLNLLDMRMAGEPDIDWDAELAKLGDAS